MRMRIMDTACGACKHDTLVAPRCASGHLRAHAATEDGQCVSMQGEMTLRPSLAFNPALPYPGATSALNATGASGGHGDVA